MGKPWEIIVGDVRRVLRELEPGSFDAAFADPPYGIAFMGARWDYSVPSVNVFTEVLRLLKPGAHAMFFGGTSTFHRMMVNIEDAGFLPVDLCMWLYGSGFPKSHDIAKAIDKKRGKWRGRATSVRSENTSMGGPNYGRTDKGRAITAEAKRWEGQGTALKPAWEPCGLFCKLHEGTIAENCLWHGTGGLDIDGTRVGGGGQLQWSEPKGMGFHGSKTNSKTATATANKKGRCPANLVLDEEAGALLDQQSGHTKSPSTGYTAYRKTFKTGVDIASRAPTTFIQGHGDQGGASRFFKEASVTSEEVEDWKEWGRFFYTQKVGREERDRGLGVEFEEASDNGRLDSLRKGTKAKNAHPADGKPRRLLVPYSGAGSEIIGALQAGWDEVVGIELVPKHAEWARARIAKGRIIQNAKK